VKGFDLGFLVRVACRGCKEASSKPCKNINAENNIVVPDTVDELLAKIGTGIQEPVRPMVNPLVGVAL